MAKNTWWDRNVSNSVLGDWFSGNRVAAGQDLPENGFRAQAAVDQNGNAATRLSEADFLSMMQKAQGQYDRANDAQNQLVGDLQAQAAGKGPSLAQMQLQQATEANARGAAGAIASQRGMNPALAQRLLLTQRASMDQNAAAQSGLLRLQEQNTARQQLANLLGQQQSGNLSLLNAGIDGNQSQNSLNLQNLMGTQGMNQATEGQNASLKSAAQAQNMGLSGYGAQLTGGALQGAGNLGAAYFASEGKKEAAKGAATDIASAAAAMSQGGEVPGRARVAGDSPANDTVPALLSPEEKVLPRSISNDPVASFEFIRTFMKHKKGGR